MAQVAAAAGVAKATLYNHFRTREAVLDALLLDEVRALAERAAGLPLADALAATAAALSDSPLLRTLARIEPATVAALGRIDRTAAGWQRARAAVDAALAADSRGGADFVLRWLASFLLTPARRPPSPPTWPCSSPRCPTCRPRAEVAASGLSRLAARAPVRAALIRRGALLGVADRGAAAQARLAAAAVHPVLLAAPGPPGRRLLRMVAVGAQQPVRGGDEPWQVGHRRRSASTD